MFRVERRTNSHRGDAIVSRPFRISTVIQQQLQHIDMALLRRCSWVVRGEGVK